MRRRAGILLVALVVALAAMAVDVQAQPIWPKPSADNPFDSIAGRWITRTFVLTIGRFGEAEAVWRTYVECKPGGPRACDRAVNEWGGKAFIVFDAFDGRLAIGRVVFTTDPEHTQLAPVWFVAPPEGYVPMAIYTEDLGNPRAERTVCHEKFPQASMAFARDYCAW